MQLIDVATQDVYRPGACERQWVAQEFGEDFVSRLEPGGPYNRPGTDQHFQRPKSVPR